MTGATLKRFYNRILVQGDKREDAQPLVRSDSPPDLSEHGWASRAA